MSEPLTVLAREKPLRARARSKKPEAGDTLAFQIKAVLGKDCSYKREHKFHEQRRWRFDFAFTERKLALEIEGGIWISGRHNRASGYVKDLEKYNAAALEGWRIVRFTPQQVHSGAAINFLQEEFKS